jgi:Zn-dependent M16 (insulinase) family peptidase
MHPRHLLLMLPFTLTTCCPPEATKTTLPRPGDGSGTVGKPPPESGGELGVLGEGSKLHGFTATTVYLDDADKPLGARFIHDATKFTLDYLRVETAPQGFIWVTSFPTSDKGEPHTQEHLLLLKGDRGRKLGSSEVMALAESSAFTAQWRTAYHFHTVAGQDVFWPVFANHLDAMVNPDYTDEEIRREVRNFGVDKGSDGKLRLDEKGVVYNEMVRVYENPDVGMWRTMGQLVYGRTHPLALDSGGEPAAMRTMTPQDIRTFHNDAYHLANMGMIAAFPSSMSLTTVLAHSNDVLVAAKAKNGRTGKTLTEADLPKPAGAPTGTLQVVDYPFADATNPGPMAFSWPPTRKLDEAERLLLGLFLDAFAGDESTVLYKKLIDSKTRVLDLGASGVWSYNTDDQGQPVFIGLSGCKPDKLDPKTMTEVRALILAELDWIAKLADGDPDLAAFNAKIASRIVDLQRRYNKFLDSPPGFGFRGASSGWMDHLQSLSKTSGFKKSLTLRPALAKVREVLGGKANPWRDRVKAWGLLEVPYGVASRPSPDERKKLDAERKQRIADELARLQKQYGTKDEPATLARYQQDYDAETKKLDAAAAATELPPLVSSLPMTLDDSLLYTTGQIGAVKTFVATFDSMASARVSLAFRLDGRIDPADGMYLAGLPALLSDSGVIVDGKPIASDEMREQIRKEILELSVYFVDDDRTGRTELVVAGAGNGAAETKTALTWMQRVLFTPDWRVKNVPRLRDLVDQRITGLRARMLGAEEGWVNDPRDAWRLQSSLQAHTSSFLTQMHDLHRLRWQLLDPEDTRVTDEVTKFFAALGDAGRSPRAQLVELAKGLAKLDDPKAKPKAASKAYDLATKLSAEGKRLAVAAGKDLSALLTDLPDGSLAADWKYLARQMAADLAFGAGKALARLEVLRSQIIHAPAMRLVEVGSRATQSAIAPELEKLVAAIPAEPRDHVFKAKTEQPFRDRLKQRDPNAADARFVGLVAPGTSSGVFVHLVPATWYADATDDGVLDYLASNLYTGHGGHSVFSKTLAAGLAYSNGIRPSIDAGVLVYYAERTPLLPQTMKFVIDELEKVKPDPSIARYAVATAFSSRVASSYEARASAMAANLVDGQTPDLVKAFRIRVQALAKDPDLATKLFARLESTYGKVLPGYGVSKTKPDPKATYFVIGPEKQLAAWEAYLKATYKDPKVAKLHRLYPRDFWIPAP